jgi:ribonucleotide reductase alpha subunit
MFRNDASEFVYTRTYSRWIEEEKRREVWPETVKRYIDFIKKNLGDKIPKKVLRKIEENIMAFNVMPSMRFMWAAGAPAEQDNVTIYNCAFAAVDDTDVFAEALYILLCGTGFGFSVENKYIEKLPIIPSDIFPTNQVYEVEDSKQGWADSVKFLFNSLCSGQDPTLDYGKLRPAGARLKTMGGRSSGPVPLIQLHSFIKQVLYSARGRKLTDLECHDIMCEMAGAVVVGGVRRSSEISNSDLHSEAMRTAKTGNFPVRRYMANNSSVYYSKPDIVTFMSEWAALIASGSGERGILNLEAAKKMAPKRRNADLIAGTNPCVVGNTEILTREGYRRIDSLLENPVEVWNGFRWSTVQPKVTGKNQNILTVSFSDGRILDCTPYHKFHIAKGYKGDREIVEAKDLQPGMRLIKHEFPVIEEGESYRYAYDQGFVSAEGMDGYDFCWVYEPKYMCLGRLSGSPGKEWRGRISFKFDHENLPKSFVPFNWNLKSKLDWLSGLFDGDGTELKEGGLQIVSTDRKFLTDLQSLLSTVGVQCKVLKANMAGDRMMPDGHGGSKLFHCQDAFRICIGAMQMQFLKKLGLKCERMAFDKTPQRDASQFVTVVDVTENGIAETVYCFDEPKLHMGIFNGVITGQCGEILLRNKEFCNLSEIVARESDDIGTILDKIETAVWMGIIQSCFTHFPYLSESWKQNCDEERLLGVSITGQFDAIHVCTPEALKAYNAKAIKIAKKASNIMGIAMPAAITCVKPSGTVSQLVDSSSGLHPRFSKYYIRRYRISAIDPLFRMIRDQGLPVTPENGQRKQDYVKAIRAYDAAENKEEGEKQAKSICTIFDLEGWDQDKVNTWIVSFPVAAPKNAITIEDVTALEQLEWYKKIQKNWCEHNASITVYVKPEEWLSVGDWVYKNWDIVNEVSFLPVSDHVYEQAPYEKITKEEYEKLAKTFPKIDYSQLGKYETEDNTEGAKSLACASGNCEIP